MSNRAGWNFKGLFYGAGFNLKQAFLKVQCCIVMVFSILAFLTVQIWTLIIEFSNNAVWNFNELYLTVQVWLSMDFSNSERLNLNWLCYSILGWICHFNRNSQRNPIHYLKCFSISIRCLLVDGKSHETASFRF